MALFKGTISFASPVVKPEPVVAPVVVKPAVAPVVVKPAVAPVVVKPVVAPVVVKPVVAPVVVKPAVAPVVVKPATLSNIPAPKSSPFMPDEVCQDFSQEDALREENGVLRLRIELLEKYTKGLGDDRKLEAMVRTEKAVSRSLVLQVASLRSLLSRSSK